MVLRAAVETRRGTELFLLIILFAALATATALSAEPGDVYYTGEVVRQQVTVSGEPGVLDGYYKDGDVKMAYGKWAILDKENETVLTDDGGNWTKLQPNSTGQVSFTHQFQRRFQEPGNYTFAVVVATADGEFTGTEWKFDEINLIAKETVHIQVVEPSQLSVLMPRNMALNTRMAITG